MSEYIQSYLALGAQLDSLSLVGFTLAALFILAIVRQYYVHFATPPAYRIQPWFPMPEDLPTEPVPPYGAPALKAGYRPNLSTGVGGSLWMHLAFILSAIAIAEFSRRPVIDRIIPWENPEIKKIQEQPEPPPLVDKDEGTLFQGESLLPPPPDSRVAIPVPDWKTLPSLTIKGMDEELLNPGRYDFGQTYDPFSKNPQGDSDNPGSRYGFQEEEETPVALQIVEQLPELVTIPEPAYPEIAKAQSIEGKVLLKVLIGKNGRVREVRVVQSIPALDEAAREAAMQAVFKPALWRNEPVAVWVSMPIRFSLRKE
jgi:periplasmic protein TonB